MAWTPKRIYGPAQPGTTATTLYTASGNVIIKEIILANTNTNNGSITIGINGTAVANQIVPAMTVTGNTTTILALSTPLTSGDTIQALQSNAGYITIAISAETNP